MPVLGLIRDAGSDERINPETMMAPSDDQRRPALLHQRDHRGTRRRRPEAMCNDDADKRQGQEQEQDADNDTRRKGASTPSTHTIMVYLGRHGHLMHRRAAFTQVRGKAPLLAGVDDMLDNVNTGFVWTCSDGPHSKGHDGRAAPSKCWHGPR